MRALAYGCRYRILTFMMNEHRIAFFGTPQLAVWVLDELEAKGIVPNIVVTAPDEPVGRKLVLTAPAVKVWAEERDIPVLQTSSLKDKSAFPELVSIAWDVFIVAAYNIILPRWVLDLPRHGVLNVHPSLLPKLRGPSPVRSAILRDEQEAVGVSIIRLDEQVDHGPIIAQVRVTPDTWPMPGRMLDEILFRKGGTLLGEVLEPWCSGTVTAEVQDDACATFTKKFTKPDGELVLTDDPYQNWLKFCAYDGWPGTFFYEIRGTGKSTQTAETVDPELPKVRIKITEAEYVDGEFRILKVIPEGKKEMVYADWIRGRV